MSLRFSHSHFRDLSTAQLHAILKLRVDVFVVEQQCAYAEVDGQDTDAWHVLGLDSQGALMAYARVLPKHGEGAAHIGRVVVHPRMRGTGEAVALMRACFKVLEDIHGSHANHIAAQEYLERFYQRLGYRTVSAPYDWDGIMHIDMVLDA
ncbi:MAG: GNAT family N-acetyltransferase [Flavobacteriales bacterium]|nr:MAG: GNAT family N-acetyltransferase [Flavobacteriales bacterium]